MDATHWIGIAGILVGGVINIVVAFISRNAAPQVVVVSPSGTLPPTDPALPTPASAPVPRRRRRLLAVLFDASLLLILVNLIALILASILVKATNEQLMTVVGVIGMIAMLLSFILVGALRRKRGWLHLFLVALAYWLMCAYNIAFGATVESWLTLGGATLVIAVIGGGLGRFASRPG